MKAEKPKPPTDLPPGTVQIGGPINWFSISLGVTGENLVPEEITAILCREPTRGWQRDKPLFRADGTFMRIPKFGAWFADWKPEETDEWNCCEAILELMETLPRDAGVWHELANRFRLSVFVGLSADDSGRGFVLSPEFMHYLGERRITAGFEIYFGEEEEG